MLANISPGQVGAVILAGGRGTRMGGVDKGLQTFRNQALISHAIARLQAQTCGAPGHIVINANRNLQEYQDFGYPVISDSQSDYAGPLAGFLAAFDHLAQANPAPEYLLTVPCDSPLFPVDLLERLAHSLQEAQADLAMASAPETQRDGSTRMRGQPVFCLIRTSLRNSLWQFMTDNGRKIDAWTGQHRQVLVAFDRMQDDPRAFQNTNTLNELRQLEQE